MSTLKRIIAGLAVCFVALACNQEELQSLQSSTFEMSGVIASIDEQVDNINATIEDLKAADAAIGQAISALQAEDEAIRAQLEADKAKIEASIDSLGNYVNDQLQAAQDWAKATFATLEQYQHLCDSVAAVKQSLEEMDARITAQLKHDLDSLESSMKTWVNEQLAGYYTIAQMDAKLAALEKSVQDGDQANADAIAQLQTDLAKQATDLTAAYEAAIAAAITENNGVIDGKIATEITTVNTRITNEVKTLSDRMDALELRIQAVEEYINSQKGFTISFTMPKDTVCFPGQTINVGYTISESTIPTQIECIPDDGWRATVTSNGNTGTIAITAPATGGNGKIIVLANRSSWTLMSTLSFDEGVLHVAQNEYPAPAQGGQLNIPFTINADYGIKIAPADTSWIHLVETKAALRNENLLLTIAANPNQSIRVGKVYIYPEEGNNDEYYELKINQASAFFSVSTTGFVVGGDVTSKEVTVTSSLPFNFDVPASAADWLSATCTLVEGMTYKITTNFTVNNGENRRTADLGFVSTDGSTRYASLAIIQDTRSEEDISAMIFEVRANIANDYTVYLPILVASGTDCYVDWGDGLIDHYSAQSSGASHLPISHKYVGLTEASSFNVVVNGKVTALGSYSIPAGLKGGLRAVVQWGKTGLVSLSGAFQDCSGLQRVVTDDIGAFEKVTSVTGMFSGCSQLDTIPKGLFAYCNQVSACSNVFSNCSNLRSLPDSLFSKCDRATTFSEAFSNCLSLESIPGTLFINCKSVQSFSQVFYNCSALKELPRGLFKDCFSAIDFRAAFQGCRSLARIPEDLFSCCTLVNSFSFTFFTCDSLLELPAGLFDNNRRVTDFSYMCEGCYSLTGESPYTIINENKIHLYERDSYQDYFVIPISTKQCFYASGSLSDYDLIPDSWKAW